MLTLFCFRTDEETNSKCYVDIRNYLFEIKCKIYNYKLILFFLNLYKNNFMFSLIKNVNTNTSKFANFIRQVSSRCYVLFSGINT